MQHALCMQPKLHLHAPPRVHAQVNIWDWRKQRKLGSGRGQMGEPTQVYGVEWNPHQDEVIPPAFLTFGRKHIKVRAAGGAWMVTPEGWQGLHWDTGDGACCVHPHSHAALPLFCPLMGRPPSLLPAPSAWCGHRRRRCSPLAGTRPLTSHPSPTTPHPLLACHAPSHL